MKRRFTLKDGQLVDRDGNALGRLVALTLELEEKGGTIGGDEEPSSKADSGSSEVAVSREESGGSGESKREQRALRLAAVWSHYVEVFNPRRKELDPESTRIIDAALKVASVEECCTAIDGNKASPFHQGENDRRKKYNRLSQILKGKRGVRTTREQIDLFLDIAEKAGLKSRVTSGDPGKVRAAKRAVLAAAEFPHDETARERGEEAEAWLRDQGWLVDRDGNGWPRFRRA